MWPYHDQQDYPSSGVMHVSDQFDPHLRPVEIPFPQVHFFDLPAEIRVRIYKLLPQTGVNIYDIDASAEATFGDHTVPWHPPIAATCRYLHEEVLKAYFSYTLFRFLRSGTWSFRAYDWLDAQPEKWISYINTFEFTSLTSHYPVDEKDPSQDALHQDRTSVRHYDKISVNVRLCEVIIHPTELYVEYHRINGLDLTCGSCDHVEYLEEIASKFRTMLNELPRANGFRRMTKSTLFEMMKLAIGTMVDGKVALPGMSRSLAHGRGIAEPRVISRERRDEEW